MIAHQVEALAAAGVTDIVLAVNYRPEVMTKALKEVCAIFKKSTGFVLIRSKVRGTIQRQYPVLRRGRTPWYSRPIEVG